MFRGGDFIKIVIAGAGAMGCRFGAMFFQTGQDVLLYDEWAAHVAEINNKGLTVIDEQGQHRIPIKATSQVDELGVADLVLIFSKSMYTGEMLTKVAPVITSSTYVMSLQNGLGNLEAITATIPKERVIIGTTNFGTELLEPGVVRALGSGETSMMLATSQRTVWLEELQALMNKAGMNVHLSDEVMTIIWSKLAFNAVMNPVCTLARLPVSSVGEYHNVMELIHRILDEIILVVKAEGIVLVKDEIIATLKNAWKVEMSGNHLPSMFQDVLNKRPTEIENLNGAIVQLAQKHGLDVPFNQCLAHLIRMIELNYEQQVEVL